MQLGRSRKNSQVDPRQVRQNRKTRFNASLALWAAAAVTAAAISADAAVGTWNGSTSTSWTEPLNWTPNTVPGNTTDVHFNQSSYTYSPDPGAAAAVQTIRGLYFDAGNTSGITFGPASTKAMKIAKNGITLDAASGNVSIPSTNLTLSIDQAWANNSSAAHLAIGQSIGADYVLTLGGGGSFDLAGVGTAANNLGSLSVNSATVTLEGKNSLLGKLTLNSGATLISKNNTSFGGVGAAGVVINGGAIITQGSTTVTKLNLNDVPLNINGDFTFNGNATKGGDFGSTASVVTLGDTGPAGARTITVSTNALAINGAISNGTATGLTKAGDSQLTLGGTSAYTGVTTINSGTLEAAVFADEGAASSLGTGTGDASGLVFGGGKLQYTTNANASTNRLFTLGNASGLSATLDASQNNTKTLSFTGTGALGTAGSGARTLTLTGTNTASNRFAPTIADGGGGATSVVKSGDGTWLLSGSSTYTGVTTVNSGTLAAAVFADEGTSSSLGAGNGNASGLVFGGGKLQYTTNANAGTNRLFTLGNANGLTATIDASQNNTKTLSFTGAGPLGTGGSGARTLALTGTNTASNRFAPAIVDGDGGATSVVKSGDGTWVLAGSNTFTGGVTVSGGTLAISNGGDATQSSLGTGTLTFAGGNLDSAATGVLTLGTKNAQAWNADFAFVGSHDLRLGNGPVTLGGPAGARTVTVNGVATRTLTVGGVISNSADGSVNGLTKTGPGTLLLRGINTYTGSTTVEAGTLALAGNGSMDQSPSVIVVAGATLDGTALTGGFQVAKDQTLSGGGTILGYDTTSSSGVVSVAKGGHIAPGDSSTMGTLTFDNLSVGGLVQTLQLKIADAGATSDKLAIAPGGIGLTLNNLRWSDFVFTAPEGGFSTTGGPFTYTLIQTNLAGQSHTLTGGLTGTLNARKGAIGNATGTLSLITDPLDPNYGNVLLTVAVPEPSPIFIALGTSGLGFVASRRRQSARGRKSVGLRSSALILRAVPAGLRTGRGLAVRA